MFIVLWIIFIVYFTLINIFKTCLNLTCAYQIYSFKPIAVQLIRQIRFAAVFYGHGEKNRFDSYVYTNNQYSSFTMFAGILLKNFDIFLINDENENHVKTTVAKQWTWVRNRMSTFLSLLNKDLPIKILYLQQIFIIFERVQISKV